MVSKTFALASALALVGCAAGPGLGAFEATLAAQDSATAALGQWCATQGLANPAVIRALPVFGESIAPPDDLATLLRLAPGETPGYRHVRLTCGDKVLSEARNWYVPSRLTPDMNATLATTDTPFGKTVAALGFRRERIASQRGRLPGCPEGTILSHRALLRLPDGRPLSALVECYTAANLGN